MLCSTSLKKVQFAAKKLQSENNNAAHLYTLSLSDYTIASGKTEFPPISSKM